jgi:hypothetical protein
MLPLQDSLLRDNAKDATMPPSTGLITGRHCVRCFIHRNHLCKMIHVRVTECAMHAPVGVGGPKLLMEDMLGVTRE